jgi:hypothetical protein
MLYFSHSFGGAAVGFAKPTFGLRLQQVRQAGNSGDPQALNDPMSHRELLDWQMERHSDMRLTLGHRLTYDLTNNAFGRPVERRAAAPVGGTRLRPITGPALASGNIGRVDSRMEAFPGNAFREPPGREMGGLHALAAAAVAALSPSHFTAQPHPLVTANRTGIAAVRPTSGAPRNAN